MEQRVFDIFEFSNHRDFLSAVIQKKKARNPVLGLRHLSNKAGFKSPASLSLILTGKRRLTSASAEKLAQAMLLTGRKRRYFLALSRLDCARTPHERRAAEDELLRIRNTIDARSLEQSQYQFLSSWYYPALYVLVASPDFRVDPVWIAGRLGRGIKPSDASKALEDMILLGLLELKDGKLSQSSGSVTTADEVKNSAVRKYHLKMSALAMESLDLELGEREFNGLTVAIPESELAKVKEKIRSFRRELNEYLDQFSSQAEQVYQLNLQLFPLTSSPSSQDKDPI